MMELWQSLAFKRALGTSWHPGGVEVTRRALSFIKPPGLALDLGCGSGASLKLLQSLGFTSLGLDLNVSNLQSSKSKEMCFLKADLLALPLKPSVADVILLECVLSLCRDPFLALKACALVLRPQGFCILSDLTLRPYVTVNLKENSCLKGAQPESFWRESLLRLGFKIRQEIDYSQELTKLAAQILWYSETNPGSCLKLKGYGYKLWVAQKD
ncbi:MAG: class I SAM-dependent methyltransferase [Desulfovibrionaceae bacterium]|nr:class I SAM-dependent methyltransferase [Desulfovibrionaceae bacterium]